MKALLGLFFSISMMGKGPQDVPYSRALFVVLLLIIAVFDLVVVNVFVARLASVENEQSGKELSVIAYVAVMSVLILSVYLLLRVHGLQHRVLQTLTAMTGVEMIIKPAQIISILLLVLGGKNSGIALLGNYLLILSFGWMLAANMHIFRHALSVSIFRAGVYSLAYFVLNITVSTLF